MPNPIICALDTKNVSEAKDLCKQIKPFVGAIKLGLEFFCANGASGIKEISKTNIPIFLDLKFHDIPNTVSEAVRAAVASNIFMLTVHTSGGVEMMETAKRAAKEEAFLLNKRSPMILGVTILTSLDQEDIDQIGYKNSVKEQVLNLASLASKANLDGIVCSPQEVKYIKDEFGSKLRTVVPGIRTESSSKNDQKRVTTPKQALELGADYLVIGRPITQAKDPAAAAKHILNSFG